MITIKQIHKEDWEASQREGSPICFSEYKDASLDRIDFALLAESGERMMGYLTCREHDAETIYWQYGGTFPGTRETSMSRSVHYAAVLWCKERYKRITTVIENTNTVMLKLALINGFKIVGCIRNHFKASF